MSITQLAILIGLMVMSAIVWMALDNDKLADMPSEHLMRESLLAMERGEADNKYSREIARRAETFKF